LCGIAGYSLGLDSRIERTVAARALLAGSPSAAPTRRLCVPRPRLEVTRAQAALRRDGLLERIRVPEEATQLLVHVRDYTKGHPSLTPTTTRSATAPWSGVHNGIIANDDELFDEHGIARAEPG
jgi:hypothetical protein